MPPKRKSTAAGLQPHATTQRTPHVQTSGGAYSGSRPAPHPTPHLRPTVFKLPIELFFEIFSHFDDHRSFIHNTRGGVWWGMRMTTECVERSTVIRKFTMTCWTLRNVLLPTLWKNVEGCVVHSRSANSETGKTYGLYPQCVYLLSNPTIASYVRWVNPTPVRTELISHNSVGPYPLIYPSRTLQWI